MRRPLAVIKVGTTVPSARALGRGDFVEWIARAACIDRALIRVVDPRANQRLPPPQELGAVIVTGSSAMVSERAGWSELVACWLRDVVEAATPLLGICYGHQLLAHALGGRVDRNPRGREIGTIAVEMTAVGDRLFGALPRRLLVQSTHVEAVVELPRGARLLGQSALDPYQVFAVGDAAWGVQFHPELDAEVMRRYIETRAEPIAKEGLDVTGLLRALRPTADGSLVLSRFAALAAVASR